VKQTSLLGNWHNDTHNYVLENVMLSQLHNSCYAEWRYTARRYGECRGATLIDAKLTYFGMSGVNGKIATVVKFDVGTDWSNGGVGDDGLCAIRESMSPRFQDCCSFWPSWKKCFDFLIN
jgi:hypothetical protein